VAQRFRRSRGRGTRIDISIIINLESMLNKAVRIGSAAVGVAVVLSACSSSDQGITDAGNGAASLTIDVTSAPAYVTLGTPATVATVVDPSTSTAWDLAFASTPTVAVNGGASGPSTVKAYCLCANSALTLAQIEALTPASSLIAFESVTAASIPADASFQLDASSQAISGWYDYNATTHAVTANGNVWGLRLASTSGAYAKLRVTAIPAPGQSNAGPVTIQWAVQPTSSSTMGADRQLVVDLTSGPKVYVNLTTGTTSASSASTWDVALQGYTIAVNGGSSGGGNVGAVLLVPSSFYSSYAAIGSIPIGGAGIPSSAFSTDGAGGAFLTTPPYRYDPVLHQVYPSYDVYLVKRGTSVYKAQVTSYYSTAGAFGKITLRYAKLAD